MKRLYSFDNYEGDKGIIIADSWDEAVMMFKENYPDREIAERHDEYLNHGCYLEEIDFVDDGLYVTCDW